MKLFFWQWRAELWKLLARKRTFLGFGAFVVLEIVLLVVFHLDKVENVFRKMIQHQGEAFESYFSALTLGYLMLRAQTAADSTTFLATCFAIVLMFVAGERLVIVPLERRFARR